MAVSIIVAMDNNYAIGKGNDLPWKLPSDLQYFKRVTTGYPIIMGRKTYESIGRPLPARLNIVVSRNPDLKIDGCTTVTTIEDAISLGNKQNDKHKCFVIGGGEIYDLAMPYTTEIIATHVDTDVEAPDTFFKCDWTMWEADVQRMILDEEHPFTIIKYTRATGEQYEDTSNK